MSFWTIEEFLEKKKIWKLLADRIGGSFIEGKSWRDERVVLNYKQSSSIILNTRLNGGGKRHQYYETKVQCSFISTNQFKLKIFHENAFTHAGKVFGINDIELDNAKFDNEFYIKSNQRETAIEFLNKDSLQKIYLAATKNLDLMVTIEIKDSNSFFSLESNPPNSFLISIEKRGEETDVERLVSWFDLCKATLDRLIEIGEAEDESPDIQ